MRLRVEPSSCLVMRAPDPGGRFEAIREQSGVVLDPPQSGAQAITHAVVACRPGEHVLGAVCARCRSFVNAVPSSDGCSVTVRCLFLESDTVDRLMTPAASLACVQVDDALDTVVGRFLRARVRQLVVTDKDQVVGLLDAGTLVERHAEVPVWPCMETAVPILPNTATLAGAAEAFASTGRRVALVVRGHSVLGLLTRGDLARAGVPGR